jgi:hypothetical protein
VHREDGGGSAGAYSEGGCSDEKIGVSQGNYFAFTCFFLTVANLTWYTSLSVDQSSERE